MPYSLLVTSPNFWVMDYSHCCEKSWAIFFFFWLVKWLKLQIFLKNCFHVIRTSFIPLWLCWVFVAARFFSSWSERGLLSGDVWAPPCGCFSCCGAQALGPLVSVVAASGLKNCSARLGCSTARGILTARVSCVGRQILYLCELQNLKEARDGTH